MLKIFSENFNNKKKRKKKKRVLSSIDFFSLANPQKSGYFYIQVGISHYLIIYIKKLKIKKLKNKTKQNKKPTKTSSACVTYLKVSFFIFLLFICTQLYMENWTWCFLLLFSFFFFFLEGRFGVSIEGINIDKFPHFIIVTIDFFFFFFFNFLNLPYDFCR